MSTLYHQPIPNASGIYRIVCTVTGKIYIGSAVNLRWRRKCHFGSLQRNQHKNPKLQSAFNKYGPDAFIFEIIELVLIPEMLIAREQYWLDTLKPFGRRGFNIVPIAGSHLGMKRSPEVGKNISKAKRGKPSANRGKKKTLEAIENHRRALTGYKHTEQAKRNMAEARKGKKHSLETREKMRLAALGHPPTNKK